MIYFECYSDQAFLRSLDFSRKDIDHSFSKGNVCNKLQKTTDSVGLTDEDPTETQPRYISLLMQSGTKIYEDQYLVFLKDQVKRNKLILVRPNIEAWALRIAKDLKLDLSSVAFQLSNNESELHEILGFSRNHKKLENFSAFFKKASTHSSISKIKDFIAN